MPARNSIKIYVENSYYHIYNRGVEKRLLFLDEQDYRVFLSYLKDYLTPKNEKKLYERFSAPNTSYKEKDKILKLLRMNNFYEEITLFTYCLMPNHFHFLIKQKSATSINKFMQSLCTRYTMYFNRKYRRVGSLFQAVYKAVLVQTDEQFFHLSKYIHKQALALQGETPQGWREKQPCSFSEFLGTRKTTWIKPDEIINYFSKTNRALSYRNFVLKQDNYEVIQNLILEEDE